MIKKALLALTLAVNLPVIAHAESDLEELRGSDVLTNEWKLVKNDKLRNIKAYLKREDGKKIRSFRIEAIIDAPMEAVARVGFDIDNYRRWYWQLLDARLLKKVSDREYIYYLVHNAPVGNPDRDVILRAVVEPYTPQKGYALVRINALPDYLPPKPPLVRMQAEDMVVKYTPLGKNKTLFENEGYIDPGGAAPVWTINFVQRQAPYAAVVGMLRMLQLPEYLNPDKPLPYKLFAN